MAPSEGGVRAPIISVIKYVGRNIAGGSVFMLSPNCLLPPVMGSHLVHSCLIPEDYGKLRLYMKYIGNTYVLGLFFSTPNLTCRMYTSR